MIVLVLYSRQEITRKERNKMAGLTQEQQSDNHFTLESILEEEDDQEEVVEEKKEVHKNNETNKSLPFDKCLEADSEVDELEKKKALCRQLGDRPTTKKESKKEIRKWLGIGTIIKTIFKVAFKPVLVHAISIAGIIAFGKLLIYSFDVINSFNIKDYFLGASLMVVSGIMILVCIAVAIGALVWMAINDYNFVEEKMRSKNYMLDENIVDCPIAAKEELLSCIKDDELYIRLDKKKNRIDILEDTIKADNWWKLEKSKGKHDIEYQMKYLADQLEDGKIYKISDIITDKAYKKLERNEEE